MIKTTISSQKSIIMNQPEVVWLLIERKVEANPDYWAAGISQFGWFLLVRDVGEEVREERMLVLEEIW